MTHHNLHPNNDSHTRPRLQQFHTLIYPLRITSRNIPQNRPKSLSHYHNVSSSHSPLPSCCCRQETRTSSTTRSNVKISFLTRIPKIELSANALPVYDEHQLYIGRRLAGDQHPMVVLKKTPQQLCLPRPPSTWVAHLRFVEPTHPKVRTDKDPLDKQDLASQQATYTKLPISPTNFISRRGRPGCLLRSNLATSGDYSRSPLRGRQTRRDRATHSPPLGDESSRHAEAATTSVRDSLGRRSFCRHTLSRPMGVALIPPHRTSIIRVFCSPSQAARRWVSGRGYWTRSVERAPEGTPDI